MSGPRGATVECKCLQCKQPFTARIADRRRGWARFCSKSCKAIKQEQRTGQYAALLSGEQGRDGHEPMDDISDMDFGASDGGGYEEWK